MYAKRKPTEVSSKRRNLQLNLLLMSDPLHSSLAGCRSAASQSGGQDFSQGAELFQNRWVCHTASPRPSLPRRRCWCLARCRSFLAQGLVHPEPEPDGETVGERHPEPLPVCGHHHPGAHLRLPEASRSRKLPDHTPIHPGMTHLMLSVFVLFCFLTEALRGQRSVEEEEDVGLRVRRTGALRHRGQEAEVKMPPLVVPISCFSFHLSSSQRRACGRSCSGGCRTSRTRTMTRKKTGTSKGWRQREGGQRVHQAAWGTSRWQTGNSWRGGKGS